MKNILLFILLFSFARPGLQAQLVYDDFQQPLQLDWQPLESKAVLHGEFSGPLPNPAAGGTNTSTQAGRYDKGVSPFSTLQIVSPAAFDLSTYSQLDLDVLSPASAVAGTTIVRMQVFSTASGVQQAEATIQTPGQWETLAFDFTGFADVTDIFEVRLVFDPGTTAPGQSWWVDNLRRNPVGNNPCAGIPVEPRIIDDFDCQRNYVQIYYGAADISVVDNPHPDADNPSAKVGKYNDPANNLYAGIGFQFAQAIDLSTYNQLHLKVWSTVANVPFLFKLEGSGPFVEIPATLTEANTWFTFDIDFSAANPVQHKNLVIFFNVANPQGGTYFLDDVQWKSATGVAPDLAVAPVRLSPNPAQDVLYVDNAEAGAAIQVFDAQGRLVRTLGPTDQPRVALDVADLAPGLYQLLARTAGGRLAGQAKFVKL